MATSTARIVCSAIAALAIAGCGAGAPSSTSGHTSSPASSAAAPGSPSAPSGNFAWLRPGPAPAGWPAITIARGAVMPYPPSWKQVHGDRGTATAELFGADRVLGYLNITPQQGNETLSDWARFRVQHNAEEGDRGVTALAMATGLRFRSGRGSCVRDSYSGSTGVRYVELACLVAGAKTTTVIVGASPPGAWPQISPVIERAISGLTT